MVAASKSPRAVVSLLGLCLLNGACSTPSEVPPAASYEARTNDVEGGSRPTAEAIALDQAVAAGWSEGGCAFVAEPAQGAQHGWHIATYDYGQTVVLHELTMNGLGDDPMSAVARAIVEAVVILDQQAGNTGTETRTSFAADRVVVLARPL